MSEAPGGRFRIEAIRKDHQRDGFDCGHPFLNAYLARFARQNDRNRIARAYVMVPAEAGNLVVGYYTVSAGEVAFEDAPSRVRRRLPRYPLPVARIGELAVDRRYQGQGLGSVLLLDALRRIVGASGEVGIWAIVVDPIDSAATAFYQHHGFEPLLDAEALFLTMEDALAWVGGS